MKKFILLLFSLSFVFEVMYSIPTKASASVDAVPVSIKATGWMEANTLTLNAIAYANRTYVFNSVSAELSGLSITRYNGGGPPRIRVTAMAAGDMYIAVSSEDRSYDPIANGWTEVSGLKFSYNDPNVTTFTVYKKAVNKDDEVQIVATGWQGVLVLSSQPITYSLVVSFTPPPGIVIHNSKADTKKFIGSPSIVVLEDGTYLASHDYFGTRTETFVYKSADKGETWERISNIMDLKWATIFNRNNEVYLIGVRVNGTEYGNTVILKSSDNGVTWTDPTNNKNGLLLNGYYHCAPVPIIIHNGKYWRAMEDQGEANGWGKFKSLMMSIDVNADLLDASNWTISNKLAFQAGTEGYGSAWLEGNAVVAKDGSVKNILRVHYGGDDKAAIVDVSADGKTSSFDPETGFVTLSGATKKFTIRYDEKSDLYWTLTNHVLPEDKTGNLERVRNTIALVYSSDLVNWTIKDIMLHVDERTRHGFQYLDWLFEGDDIIAVSRTAWDDETGQADSQHNANYITFHRFKNFRFSKPTTTATGITVKRWYKDAKSAIALTFDDGFKAHYEHAYPILKQYDIKSTFFVNSGNLAKAGDAQKERYGFWEDFKEMADNGFEIASHTVTHPDLTTLTYDVVIDELKKDKEAIETNIGKPCYTVAYPYCNRNEEVDVAASMQFIAGRQCGGIANEASLSNWNWNSLNSDLLTWTYPRSLANEAASAASLKSTIQSQVRQSRKFGVLCIHEVLPFNLLSTSSTYEIATTEWLTEMCQYLDEKRTSGDIWPSTFSNIVRYAKERDNLRVNKIDLNTDSIKYEFTTWLDTAVYNIPLSIDITTPSGWEKVVIYIKEGENIISTETYESAPSKIATDIIPDKQHIIISKKTSTAINPILTDNPIEVYPNPVKDFLYIDNQETEKNKIEIFALNGKKIIDKTITDSLNVKTLTPGSYILRVNGKQTTKFIKE